MVPAPGAFSGTGDGGWVGVGVAANRRRFQAGLSCLEYRKRSFSHIFPMLNIYVCRGITAMLLRIKCGHITSQQISSAAYLQSVGSFRRIVYLPRLVSGPYNTTSQPTAYIVHAHASSRLQLFVEYLYCR